MQKACMPSPREQAMSTALVSPFFMAMAAPRMYAQQAFSKAMVWMLFTSS